MEAVRIDFSILEDGKKAPTGFQQIDFHMIFDVKLDGSHWKARLVAGVRKQNLQLVC